MSVPRVCYMCVDDEGFQHFYDNPYPEIFKKYTPIRFIERFAFDSLVESLKLAKLQRDAFNVKCNELEAELERKTKLLEASAHHLEESNRYLADFETQKLMAENYRAMLSELLKDWDAYFNGKEHHIEIPEIATRKEMMERVRKALGEEK